MWPSMGAGKSLRKRMSNNIYATRSETLEEIQISNQGAFSPANSFIAQQTFMLFVSSWNVGGIAPPDNLSLDDLLDTQNSMADIYVLGFQEIVPLNAGNILGSENNNICTKWNALIKETLNKRMETEGSVGKTPTPIVLQPLNSTNSSASDFQCIISKQLVGIYISIWVRAALRGHISYPSVSSVACGLLGRLGNKNIWIMLHGHALSRLAEKSHVFSATGAVSVRFCLWQTSFCFVCSHLASGGKEGDERQRNADAARILSHTVFPISPLQNLPRKILDHDQVIWLGDLNYRINLPEAATRSLVKNKEWSILLQNDQLKAELAKDHVFEGWTEDEIKFAPTYKYNQNSDDYYGCNTKIKEKNRRTPAWCDRIIWFGKGLKQIQYNRGGIRLSDHRPVQAIFMAEVEVLSKKYEDL